MSAPQLQSTPEPTPNGVGWQYVESGRRDLRLDFLRGFCAFAMVVDHLGGASFLYPLTGGNRFFVSAAEGFIFLSGLLVGLIYGPRVARDGLAAVQLHLLRRALTLYGVTLGLTFTFVGLSRLAGMPWLQDVEPLTPQLVVSLLTLHRTYYLVDVMLLYTVLLLGAPIALLLLHVGRTWALVAASVGLWGVHLIFPREAAVPWEIANNETFRVSAWQLWFFGGMVIGYHRDAVWGRLRRLPLLPSMVALTAVALMLVMLRVTTLETPDSTIVAANGVPATQPAQTAGKEPDSEETMGAASRAPAGKNAIDQAFDKHYARPGRVLAFTIFFPLFYLAVTYLWRPLERALGWLLLPFGQNALYVYAMHLFAIFLTALVLPYVPGFDRSNPWLNTPVQLAAVLLIWLLVKRQVLFDVVPR